MMFIITVVKMLWTHKAQQCVTTCWLKEHCLYSYLILLTTAKWLFRLPHCQLWSNKCTRFTEDTMYVLILWSDWLDKSSLGKWFLKIVDMLKVLLCLFKLIWWWSFGVISLCDILGKSKDSNERGVFWNGKWDQVLSTWEWSYLKDTKSKT